MEGWGAVMAPFSLKCGKNGENFSFFVKKLWLPPRGQRAALRVAWLRGGSFAAPLRCAARGFRRLRAAGD